MLFLQLLEGDNIFLHRNIPIFLRLNAWTTKLSATYLTKSMIITSSWLHYIAHTNKVVSHWIVISFRFYLHWFALSSRFKAKLKIANKSARTAFAIYTEKSNKSGFIQWSNANRPYFGSSLWVCGWASVVCLCVCMPQNRGKWLMICKLDSKFFDCNRR